MPDEQERHYNINKLNRLFAAASIVLFFALIWLFMDDYSRSWKKYQKAFRDLELEKTRVKFGQRIPQTSENAGISRDQRKRLPRLKTKFPNNVLIEKR